jgi:hypothetical protein
MRRVRRCTVLRTAGAVYSRGGIAQVGAELVCGYGDKLQRPLLEGTEGLLVKFKGDDHAYVAQLTTGGWVWVTAASGCPCL